MKQNYFSDAPLFISEIGLNHNGDVNLAEKMIIESAKAGANAVKFQTFIPEKMNSIYTADILSNDRDNKADFEVINFLKQFVLSEKNYRHLKSIAHEEGLIFFSAPFDDESLKLLIDLDVALLKVASGEITNHQLLKSMAATSKPVILSTGMSSENEIKSALKILEQGTSDLALMHCVSLYPVKDNESNMKRITSLQSIFNYETGLSDHSNDILNPIIAASLGSTIFEKHFILDEYHKCPDKDVSILPSQFREMVDNVTRVFEKLGDGKIQKKSREDEVARAARRSLFAANDIKSGEKITKDILKCLRPGTGIGANMLDEIIGKTVNRNIDKDSIIRISDLD